MLDGKRMFTGLGALAATVAVTLGLVLGSGCGGGDQTTGTASQTAKEGGNGGNGAATKQIEGEGEAAPGSNGTSPRGGASGGGTPGGSSSSSGGGEASVNAAFIGEADAICAKWGAQIKVDAQRGYSGDLNGSTRQEEEGVASLIVATERFVVPDLESELRDVGTLNAPAGAQDAQQAAMAAIHLLLDEAKSAPEALISGGKAVKKAAALTKPHGFTACGSLVGELN